MLLLEHPVVSRSGLRKHAVAPWTVITYIEEDACLRSNRTTSATDGGYYADTGLNARNVLRYSSDDMTTFRKYISAAGSTLNTIRGIGKTRRRRESSHD
jgi:hypothetical protein